MSEFMGDMRPGAPGSRRAECCFCAELAGERTEMHELYPDLESRLLLETDGFVAMPSLGQLAPGHLLLVPRQHVTSFGQLDVDRRREAEVLYGRIRSVLAHQFSPVISFEHGAPPNAQSGGCGIVHAHIHFVPVGSRPTARPGAVGEGWSAIRGSWMDAAAILSERGRGYLMWHEPGRSVSIEPAQSVRSQHLRRHVARVLGIRNWDWRAIGAQPEFAALMQQGARVPRKLLTI